MVDRKDPIEVIHFMLNQFREIIECFCFVPVPICVLRSNLHPAAPLQPHHEVRKRKTVVPEVKFLFTPPHIFRIHQLVPDPAYLHEDHPDGHSDLHRAYPAAEPMRPSKLRERVLEIPEHLVRLFDTIDGDRPLPKQRVSQQHDSLRRHAVDGNALPLG